MESKKLLTEQIGTFVYGSKSQLFKYSALAADQNGTIFN